MEATTPGKRIQQLRILRGWSQETLAAEAGLSTRTVIRFEHDQTCSRRTAGALAKALGVETLLLSAPRGHPMRPADAEELQRARALGGFRDAFFFPEWDTPTNPQAIFEDVGPKYVQLYKDKRLLDMALAGPKLISALAATNITSTNAELASQIYEATGRYLVEARNFELALVSLQRGLAIAEQHGLTFCAGGTRDAILWTYTRLGEFDRVENLGSKWADECEPKLSITPDAQKVAVWGWMVGRAGAAAARNNRPSKDFIHATMTAGQAMPHEVRNVSAFRIDTARGYMAEAYLIEEHFAEALEVNRSIQKPAQRHMLDRAFIHARLHQTDEARQILHDLNAQSPSWLVHQALVISVVDELTSQLTATVPQDLVRLRAKIAVPEESQVIYPT